MSYGSMRPYNLCCMCRYGRLELLCSEAWLMQVTACAERRSVGITSWLCREPARTLTLTEMHTTTAAITQRIQHATDFAITHAHRWHEMQHALSVTRADTCCCSPIVICVSPAERQVPEVMSQRTVTYGWCTTEIRLQHLKCIIWLIQNMSHSVCIHTHLSAQHTVQNIKPLLAWPPSPCCLHSAPLKYYIKVLMVSHDTFNKDS